MQDGRRKTTRATMDIRIMQKVDGKSKIIVKFTVTDASVHDSQQLDSLLEEKDRDEEIYADSAYVGQEDIIEKGA